MTGLTTIPPAVGLGFKTGVALNQSKAVQGVICVGLYNSFGI